MAEQIETNLSMNSFAMNNHTNQEGECSIFKPNRDGANTNKSSNRLISNSMLSHSPRQELFPVEISKVQELILEQEHSFEVELQELEQKLHEIEEENNILESQIVEFESKESDESEKLYEQQIIENKELANELATTSVKIKEIRTILDEYYRTVARFKGQFETEEQQLKDQKKCLSEEIDFGLRLVNTMEAEFNSIHQRYEKCKSIHEHLKDNERKLADLLTNSGEKTKYLNFDLCQKLKEFAKENLDLCNRGINNTVKASKTELAKVQAILQRVNLKVDSQNEAILQISNEITETNAMCDRLIGRFNKLPGSFW